VTLAMRQPHVDAVKWRFDDTMSRWGQNGQSGLRPSLETPRPQTEQCSSEAQAGREYRYQHLPGGS
jgi:hypothetical protein